MPDRDFAAFIHGEVNAGDDVSASRDGDRRGLIDIVGFVVIFGHVDRLLVDTPVPISTDSYFM